MRHLPFTCLLLALFVFGASCSENKKSIPVQRLVHRPVDLGDKYLGAGGFLAYCEGSVVGLELHPAVTQPFFKLTPDGSFYLFGSKGRGPGEFLMPFSLQLIGGSTVGVLDAQTKRYSEFEIPVEGATPKVSREIDMQSQSTRMIKTARDQYISLAMNEERMFSMMDSTGVRIDTFFEYPYRDAAERDDASRSMAYQGTLAANPSKTKFVYTSFSGEIIRFYSIEESGIDEIARIENEYPEYRDESDENIRGVSFDAKGKEGYIATYATDNYVYAIYSGMTKLERIEKKSTNFEGTILRVFDWTGVPVREFELDVPCSYLCVSDDDKKMWAVATAPDGEIVLAAFDLENPTARKQEPEVKPTGQTNEQATQSPFPVGGKPQVPTGARAYGLDVQTKDGKRNEATQKVMDSIRNLPKDVTLDLRPTDRYDVRIDTIDNVIVYTLVLKE